MFFNQKCANIACPFPFLSFTQRLYRANLDQRNFKLSGISSGSAAAEFRITRLLAGPNCCTELSFDCDYICAVAVS